MVLSIELLIVSGLIMGEHVPPICYISLGKDKKPHTSILPYLAGVTAKRDITYMTHYYPLYYLTNRVGGQPPSSKIANESDDTPIAHWAQAPRTRALRQNWAGTSYGSQDDPLPPSSYLAPQVTFTMPPEMIRMRKSNVPTFKEEANRKKTDKYI
ncbi:hypothetical protein M9H77_02704 [Catharanthus roseus]|uniref:Uncharacterized protein n=1 Tax=Catharanthus roseus TaxID=4058 RepID=A0ACC0C9M5_CATRO|nr:hypothetical protein M9H77_02704 [Catharanthus roseus]